MSKRKQRKPRKVFYFLVDGETEKWYLELMKQYEKEQLPKIDIKPEIPQKRKLRDLHKQILENAQSYDKVFWVFDLDAIVHDEQFSTFGDIVRELRKIENVSILVNSPCLEFWVLLHFKRTAKVFHECCRVEKHLRKNTELKYYEKTEKYYKSGRGIYASLKNYQRTAIENAEKLGELSLTEEHQAIAGIGKIFDQILT